MTAKEIRLNFYGENDSRAYDEDELRLMNEYLAEFLKWLTENNCKYAIMYGGTPELEKDYRFCCNENDYTIEEVINEYNKTNI